MAKYEKCFQGEFDQVLDGLDRGIRSGSGTARFEDGSDLCCGGARLSLTSSL